MRYLYQIIAMRGRYARRRKSWQPHLEMTRRFILASAERCANRCRVVVLGSGLLLDFPLAELAALFDEVVLADIVHLPEVRDKIKPYPNVRLAQCDVTGAAEELYKNCWLKTRELPQGTPFFPEVDADAGMLISLNLVSQLSVVPFDYVTRKIPEFERDVLSAWCDEIRAAHVQSLREAPCDVCLVADYAYAWLDRDGKVVEEGSTIGSLVFPEPEQVWTWHIAPHGEITRKWAKDLTVGAWYMRHEEKTARHDA